MENLSVPSEFERVWARVNAVTVNELPETPDKELERFIQAEINSITAYQKLMQQLNPAERQPVLQILADEKRHLKNLQMEYFMETGDTCSPKIAGKMNADGLLIFLRRCILAEKEASAAYLKAAEGRHEELKSMYRAIGGDEERHSVMLKELLRRCFRERD